MELTATRMNGLSVYVCHTYLYTLRDPRNDEIRYVGCTADPIERLNLHCGDKKTPEKYAWVLELRSLGLRPVMHLELAFPDQKPYPQMFKEALKAEHFLIAYLRGQNYRLFNKAN